MANLWQSGQKWFILGLTFKMQKTTLRWHDSYSTQKTLKYKLNIQEMTPFRKVAKLAILKKAMVKAKSSKMTYLATWISRIKNNAKNDPKHT